MTTNREKYFQLRREGCSVGSALAYARRVASLPKIEIQRDVYGHYKGEWQQDGFDLRLHTRIDTSPDLSWMGKFTSNWVPGAIAHEPARHDRTLHRWFVPGISYEEHFNQLIIMKYGKSEADRLARQYVKRDYDRLRKYGDDWEMLGVIVTVSLSDVEFAENSLWGIESDSDEEYFIEVADELATQGLLEAKRKMQELIALQGVVSEV